MLTDAPISHSKQITRTHAFAHSLLVVILHAFEILLNKEKLKKETIFVLSIEIEFGMHFLV